MAARGAYAKGIAKRDEILTTALAVVAQRGFHRTTVRDLADAVGLSQAGLMHYFGTKEDLFIEILRRRDAELDTDEARTAAEREYAMTGLVDVARHNAAVPGLVQLYAQFATTAAEEGHPAHAYFQERFAEYRRRVSALIRSEQSAGHVPESLDPDRLATVIAAVTDGLQTQWMLDPSLDMPEHIRFLFDAVGIRMPPDQG